MTFRHIEYTVAVARTGSISQAARKLLVSQPYLSGMLTQLEKELGFPLFIRTNSGVTPTEEGKKFLEHAARIMHDMEAIYEIKPASDAPLKIASYFSQFITEKFFYFCDRFPGNLPDRLSEMGNLEVIEAVSEGKSSIGLIYCAISKLDKFRDLAEKNSLIMETLPIELKPYAIMSNLHELAWKQEFTPDDFKNSRYVFYDDESSRLYLEEHLGIRKNAPFIEARDRASFTDALRTGKYISLINLPKNNEDKEFMTRPIRNLDKLEDDINVKVSVLRLTDYKLTKRERKFIDFIMKA